jgi:hypothetical protein
MFCGGIAMTRARLLGLFALVLTAGWLLADDPKKDPAPTPVVPGTLPTGWKKLGLTDEQAAKIKQISGGYRIKIETLEQQIKDLKKQELEEEVKLLTDAQKARLKEIAEEKIPGELKKLQPGTSPDKTEDPKKDDSKKDDTKKKDDSKKE